MNNQRNYSEEVASDIDREVRKLITTAYEECRILLSDNIDKLHDIAAALMDKETLDAEELKEIVGFGNVTKKEPAEKDDHHDDDDTTTPLLIPVEEPAKNESAAKETAKEAVPVDVANPEPNLNTSIKD